jgi:hypothetical protein
MITKVLEFFLFLVGDSLPLAAQQIIQLFVNICNVLDVVFLGILVALVTLPLTAEVGTTLRDL